jgi:hypothetical protein
MSDDDGEVRDSAEPEETALDHAEPSDDAETEFHPFDETYDDFKPGPAQYNMGPDGLPITVDLSSESDIPALSTTSLICMGDFSKFVLRDRWGDVIVSFEPNEVERAPNGRWRVKTDTLLERAKLGIERMRAAYQKIADSGRPDVVGFIRDATDAQILVQMLIRPGRSGALDPEWVVVRPLRPPCKHYVRQQGSFHLNAANRKYYRLCSARRTTEGTFMTVSDTGMWACDMRDPYDVESTKVLDDFDKLKIDQGSKRQHLPMFRGGNGVFDSPTVEPGLGKE